MFTSVIVIFTIGHMAQDAHLYSVIILLGVLWYYKRGKKASR